MKIENNVTMTNVRQNFYICIQSDAESKVRRKDWTNAHMERGTECHDGDDTNGLRSIVIYLERAEEKWTTAIVIW
jgi:hypothetical protein